MGNKLGGVRQSALNKKPKNTGTTNPIVKSQGRAGAQKGTPSSVSKPRS